MLRNNILQINTSFNVPKGCRVLLSRNGKGQTLVYTIDARIAGSDSLSAIALNTFKAEYHRRVHTVAFYFDKEQRKLVTSNIRDSKGNTITDDACIKYFNAMLSTARQGIFLARVRSSGGLLRDVYIPRVSLERFKTSHSVRHKEGAYGILISGPGYSDVAIRCSMNKEGSLGVYSSQIIDGNVFSDLRELINMHAILIA